MVNTPRRSLRRHLEALWYRRSWLSQALLPLGLVYRAGCALQAGLYRLGLLTRVRVRVPVIAIGNITAGGTGKTPLTLWLATALLANGWSPGIVCRSYRASAIAPSRVGAADDPAVHGDEAVLLAARLACPVWSGPRKADVARALLGAHLEVDVLICDDALQHHALARDLEIAVVDAERGLGNMLPLPAGPLREPPSRLATVDAVVIHGGHAPRWIPAGPPRFDMRLEGKRLRSLGAPLQHADPAQFAGKRIAAVAGIGNPHRFFTHLRALGMRFTEHAFPDHHRYRESDLRLPDTEVVLMTEKDAIKCAAFADARMWVLPVAARVDGGLVEFVMDRIGKPGTRTTPDA